MQPTWTLTGTLHSVDGTPLVGAVVRVTPTPSIVNDPVGSDLRAHEGHGIIDAAGALVAATAGPRPTTWLPTTDPLTLVAQAGVYYSIRVLGVGGATIPSPAAGATVSLDDVLTALSATPPTPSAQVALDALDARLDVLEAGGGGGGVTDHGALTGLGDDDHPQYLTTGRGDERYVQGSDARLADAETAVQPADLTAYAPETFGAVGDGVADDTLAMQDALDAAGANGAVELSDAVYLIAGTLDIPDGCELRGTSRRGSVIRLSADITALRTVGGEGQQIRNLTIHNTFTGTRTTYDILMVNPYHPIINNVEIALSQDSRQKGGIHLLHDVAQANPTQKNMPVLDNVFIRNGVLKVEDVGDVKVDGGWTWGTYTEAPGAVDLDRASNFIAVNHDVIPSVNAGYYISGGTSNFTIIGGLMDGNGDPAIHPGPGMKVATGQFVRSLQFVGVKFWNLWQSALDLYDARAVTITGCEFRSNNREDASHPEIKLTASRDVVVVGNTFSSVNARVNKGRVLVEDAASSNNLITANTIESGHNYASGVYTVQESSLVQGNVPVDSWPRTELLAKSSNYTVTKYDMLAARTILTTSAVTITLPSSGSVYAGSTLTVKAGATTTLATTSGQTIDGSTLAPVLLAGESVTVVADGGNWRTLGNQRAPKLVVPPLSVMALLAAATWGAANLAVLSRFALDQPTSLRYANIRIDVASGNWQVSVVALTGSGAGDYTRVMTTGVQAMPAAGDKRIDLAQTLLPPGDYAVVVWCDNTTAQLRTAANSSVPVTHLAAEVAGLVDGLPASGSGLVWNSSRIVGSVTIEPA